MRIVKMILKYIGFGMLIFILAVVAYLSFFYLTRNFKSEDVIVIEATFMQYACGEEVDDMRVYSVNKKKYYFLVGKDIDPQVFSTSTTSELKGYFRDNDTEKYGMTYRMKGRLSWFYNYGCGNTTPKFWVEEIEKLDGSGKLLKKDITKLLLPQ